MNDRTREALDAVIAELAQRRTAAMKAFQDTVTELESVCDRDTASKLLTDACLWVGIEAVSDSLSAEAYQCLTRYLNGALDHLDREGN